MSIEANQPQQNWVEISVGEVTLCFSYRTLVALFVPGPGWLRTGRKYSATTNRHMNRYLPGYAHVIPDELWDEIVATLDADFNQAGDKIRASLRTLLMDSVELLEGG